MIKIEIDNSGFPVAFYNSAIHNTIPAEAIEISQGDYEEFNNNPELRIWDTLTNTIQTYTPQAETIESIVARYKAEIDSVAESQRLKYITPGYGQTLVYAEKVDQATDYLVDGSPSDMGPYPLIQVEMDVTGMSGTDAANSILSLKASWLAKASQIESLRLAAKRDISLVTTTEADVITIFDIAKSSIELV